MMKKNRPHPVSIFPRVRFILMLIVFALVFAAQFGGGIYYVSTHLVRGVKDLESSYDEKMRSRWGWYYDFVSFIKENTPDDANILFPRPSNRYPRIGNLGLNSYFLLPRGLHHGNRQTLDKLRAPVYVVIRKEFPSFEVEGLRIMRDSENGLIHYRPKS